MDQEFIRDLYFYCTENPIFSQDKPQTERFFQLEREFINGMGYDFVMGYQAAADELHAKEFEAAFLSGLQFAARFMLTVFPPQTSSPSAPKRRRAAEISSQP